ncbi:serine/threonine protein kinase [Penicillium vulpinum]|uniref:serine/threonine protein kinase n=1 Tax=Penicillium vulpinum TaxID=29845 RepID=UPI0025475BA4|nr:serine/threonine protein kinase [Penicillium vulpinum]KAJ5951224.1 serine/threonine protein kinase [Penicillium vulpinum]
MASPACTIEKFSAVEGLATPKDRSQRTNLFTDIKVDSILFDCDETPDDQVVIKNVQISDLEDVVVVPSRKWPRCPLCGNAI